MRTYHPTQTAYLAALAQCDVIAEEYRASDRIFDAAYEAAGSPEDFQTFYSEWAAANPTQAAEAQCLCDASNAARDVLKKATDALLAWSLSVALTVAKTANDRAALRQLYATTKPVYRAKVVAMAMQLDV